MIDEIIMLHDDAYCDGFDGFNAFDGFDDLAKAVEELETVV